MPANVESMAYHGEVPWHGLGTSVPRDATSDLMISAAGLDWEVEKRPARGAATDSKGRASRYEIVRLPRNENEHEVLLAVVSRRYEPLQNRDAFGFFDPIVEGKSAFFETAGSLGEGERIWVMAKMPDAMEIVRGDECMKYLLLSNTHNGQGSVIVKFTAVRVVCQNTLMLSLDDGQPTLRVRHSKMMKDRLQEAAVVIAAASQVYEKTGELFRAMAAYQLTCDAAEQYFSGIFPPTPPQKKKDARPPRVGHLLRILDSQPDLQMDGVRGTLWGAYNAVTRFEDYKERDDETSGDRLNRVWFGSGAEIKLNALKHARTLLGSI